MKLNITIRINISYSIRYYQFHLASPFDFKMRAQIAKGIIQYVSYNE